MDSKKQKYKKSIRKFVLREKSIQTKFHVESNINNNERSEKSSELEI